jgi:hypothetical protein
LQIEKYHFEDLYFYKKIRIKMKNLQLSTTLIIHPEDQTTKFLDPIYTSIPNKKLIRDELNSVRLNKEMEGHSRIIMLGHGSPLGLLCPSPKTGRLEQIVNIYHAEELSKHPENIYIWCYAERFVLEHDLSGLYSGMFISEVGEAAYCGLGVVSQDVVDESNTCFSLIMAHFIHLDKFSILKELKLRYGQLAKKNPVAAYNVEKLYAR